MKHQPWNLVVAAITACAFIYACGQESSVGSRFVKSEAVAASKGAAISVSASEEPALAGLALDIPAGALGADTTITLELGLTALSDSARGPVAIWGPSGTVFSKPARMTLPLALGSTDELGQVEILVEESDGRRFSIPRSELMIDASAKSVTFPVNGFTRFQPTVRPADGGTTNRGGGAAGTGGGAGGGSTALGGGSARAGGSAGNPCASVRDCNLGEVCVMQNPGALGVCTVGGVLGGGSAGTGGGSTALGGGRATGGGAGGGSTALGGGSAGGSCANSTQCAPNETCLIRTPGTVGQCVPSANGGGNPGAGGGTSGTGGGNPAAGGGSAQPCRSVLDCQAPLTCVNLVCQ
ncbi:MAG: hypothetical protein GQE15_37040 [Archangiaceae bacterium]|nr:hypothetical protein [Archangiaceae bacterium]